MSRVLRLKDIDAILLAALIACGCAAPPAPPAQPPDAAPLTASAAPEPAPAADVLSGIVRDAKGKPVAGALVAVIPHFELEYAGAPPAVPVALTDTAGRYHFPTITPGRYSVTTTFTGAGAAYGGIHEIAPGARIAVDLALGGEGFAVTGTIRDSAGAPAPGARLQAARLSPDEGDVYVAFTDAAGHYSLSLPGGLDCFLVVDALPRPRAYRQITAASQTADFQLAKSAAPRPTDAEIKAFLATSAVPLTTLQPGSGTADLAPLKAMIGDARIVSIGEATHGSAEFFLLRHRLLELLAGEMGFTVLAIEAGWSDAQAVNEYVLHGKGDPVKALLGLYYWSPGTEEMLAVVRWMRRYNQDPSHKKKLRFQGFDMNFSDAAVKAVLSYLGKVDAKGATTAAELLAPLQDVTSENTYPALDPAVTARTAQGVADLLARFDAERAAWIARSSEQAWTLARQHMNVIRQAEASYRNLSARDPAMAENTQWILEHEPPGTKIVLWAHNSHLSPEQIVLSQMGKLLKKRYGSGYFMIGTGFGAGAFNALDGNEMRAGVHPITLGPAPAGSLEAALGLAGHPLFAVDLRTATGPVGAWFDSKVITRAVGGIFRGEEASVVRRAPRTSFDAVIYMDRLSASHLLPGAR